MGLQPALAALVTVIGIALTIVGVVLHLGEGRAVAPGALLTLVGAAWLGISLALADVRLLPGTHIARSDEANTP